jgi:hypothetical protein
LSTGNEAVRYERRASTRLFLAVAASAVFVSVLTAVKGSGAVAAAGWAGWISTPS